MAHHVLECSVAIVGGGLSGAYLASLLQAQGVDYVLLEAKPQLGGRIVSHVTGDGSGHRLDLGPTWFWPHQQKMQGLLKSLGIRYFEQYDDGDVLYQLSSTQPPQRAAIGSGMSAYRVVGGMQAVIDGLGERLSPERVHLNTRVEHIVKQGDIWRLRAQIPSGDQLVYAQHLVCALPPRVLLEQLAVESFLPEGLCQALQQVPTWMAAQAKFTVSFPSAFWREMGLSGSVFSRVGPLAEIHDAGDDARESHALFGFLGVPAYTRLQQSQQAMIAGCLSQLRDIFGSAMPEPLAVHYKDWAQDAHVVSRWDLGETPRHPSLDFSAYQSQLNAIRCYFSVSEVAAREAGYLEGALIAGETVAEAIV